MTYHEQKDPGFSTVIPIMEGIFKGYHTYPMNSIKPSIIYDDMSYLVNFMVTSNQHKFIKLLKSDEILNVEVGFYIAEDKKLGFLIIFNHKFRFKCTFSEKDQAGRRSIYEAFELSKQLIVWNMDGDHQLLRVQKIHFDFRQYLSVFNKYLLQV